MTIIKCNNFEIMMNECNNKFELLSISKKNKKMDNFEIMLNECINKFELLSISKNNKLINFDINDFIISINEWFYNEEVSNIVDINGLCWTPDEAKSELYWFNNYWKLESCDENDAFVHKINEYYLHLQNELNIYNAVLNSGNVTIRRKK